MLSPPYCLFVIVRFTVTQQQWLLVLPHLHSVTARQDVVEAGFIFLHSESSDFPLCQFVTSACIRKTPDWFSTNREPFHKSSARKPVPEPAQPVRSQSNAGLAIRNWRSGEWSSNHCVPDWRRGSCRHWHTLPVWSTVGWVYVKTEKESLRWISPQKMWTTRHP